MRKFQYLALAATLILLLPMAFGANGDFTISSSPSTLRIVAGNSGSATITVSSTGGFSGTVSLSSSVSPSTPTVTATLNPSSLSVSPGPSSQSALTVSTTPFTPLGTYTVTVTGSSGSLSHSTQILVAVVSSTVGGVVLGSQSGLATSSNLALILLGAIASTFFGLGGIKSISAKRNRI